MAKIESIQNGQFTQFSRWRKILYFFHPYFGKRSKVRILPYYGFAEHVLFREPRIGCSSMQRVHKLFQTESP